MWVLKNVNLKLFVTLMTLIILSLFISNAAFANKQPSSTEATFKQIHSVSQKTLDKSKMFAKGQNYFATNKQSSCS